MVCPKSQVLWTFGYASLIWKPGFNYSKRVVGYIKDYKRRFYQGTTTHRGTPEWPGRVATIIKDDNSIVWGVAYEVTNSEEILKALIHLAEREMITGGYHFDKVTFYPHNNNMEPIEMYVYVADPENVQFLGHGGSIEVQAYQIAKSQGVCGRNSEYVDKVVDFMKIEVDSYNWMKRDSYLFELHKLVVKFQMGVIEPSQRTKEIVPLLVKEVNEDNELKESKRRGSA